MIWLLIFLLGCNSCQSGDSESFDNLDQGQQHPPIPANNPAWEWDAGGFVPDFGWYGEHSWADVYMRVAGHISAIGRDKARLHAERKELAQAAESYRALAKELRSIQQKSAASQYANAILDTLVKGAERDSAWLKALAAGKAPTESTGQISQLRSRYYQLALKKDQGTAIDAEVIALQKDILKHIKPRPELKIDGFKDFNDRHDLRGRLFEAYIDSLDPLGLSERWGYWKASEINRQLFALGWAAGILGGEDWSSRLIETYGAAPDIADSTGSIFLPSTALKALQDKDQALSADATEFGRLPTGDSLIDVGGTPGPMAIGTLMKWGLEDKSHRNWLKKNAKAIVEDLDSAETLTEKALDRLKAGTHGSKYYNIKQFRNAVVRQLARNKRYSQAYAIWMKQFPFKYQDWACPNREGIVMGIAGRLLAQARDPKAMATIDKAMDASLKFYQMSLKAEAGKINGPRPPAFGSGQGSHKGANHHKNPQPHQGSGEKRPAQPPPRR